MWTRIASMYSYLNLAFVLIFRWLSADAKDIVRASTFLILVVVATMWFSGNLPQLYGELIDSVDDFSIPREVRIALVAVGDILVHLVPVCIIGLPRTGKSFLIAFGVMLTWYMTVRDQMHEIYVPSIQGEKADRGVLIAGLVALASYFGHASLGVQKRSHDPKLGGFC
jgi:hypothetical protein